MFLRTASVREKITVFSLALIVSLGLGFWLTMMYRSFTVPVPAMGGVYTEGMIGAPTHLNPLLLVPPFSSTDDDLVSMIYSSLFSYDDTGAIVPDIAENLEVSGDGKTYTIHMKRNVKWHDGRDLTADDVLFTVRLLQDPAYRSPLRANWQGVDVSKQDDFTVIFSLKKAYFDFSENLIVGILPKHVWEGISPERFALADANLNPIGSGPYRAESFKKDSNGSILSYELRAFPNYFGATPHIQKLLFYFYGSEEALLDAYDRREVQGMSNISPEKFSAIEGRKDAVVHQLTQPRVFAVFLNEKKNAALADESVRRALSLSTDREEIVRKVLRGYGRPAFSPFLKEMIGYSDAGEKYAFNADEAAKVFDDAGWKRGDDGLRAKDGVRLEFDLSTLNWPNLVETANILKTQWESAGAVVSVRVLETTTDAQQEIGSRNYSALLSGLATTFDPDPYSFWHSSQKEEPGHNFSQFENKDADNLLATARETIDNNARAELYRNFQGILAEKMPAVFLYAPDYLYVMNNDVSGFSVKALNTPSSRFEGISRWYVETKRVWK